MRAFARLPEHGEKAIAKVRRTQPAVYLKVLALLIPRQDKLEHSNAIKEMKDEEIESAIASPKGNDDSSTVGART